MKRAWFACALSLACFACTGWSDDRAEARCDAEQAQHAAMWDDEAMSECVQCFESCGDDCALQSTSPVRYLCTDHSGD